ncbi:CD109 antigen-like [Ruditapes philippinarum]|uniref:CD109 antigen-like n=1 Tax=Ruditapes philippinarum TaxID=129788 RepID=UPI00295B1AE4|nr:CD109 antigen-like [Ruditapes philippinarum]
MLSNTREMLLELFILSVAVSFSDGGSYIATFPDSLIPGVNLDVRITVLGASGTVNTVASLHYAQNNSEISSTAKQVANGVPSTLAIKVPAGLSLSQYMVSISGSGGLTFKNESKVNYEANNLFLFLQTDKTRYSAGQEVKYRAILLHPNLLGYKGPLTITVFDGKSNKIDVIDHLTTKDGVVSGKLTLSREPVFGTWTIQVDAVRKVLRKNFEVNDYVVPRFSVQITLQKEIQQTMSFIELSVKARFTFNNDVLGNCTIQIYNKNKLTKFVEYWKQIRGEVNFTIPMADLRRNLSVYDPIIVRAMVTDNATALTIAAEEDLKFSSDSHSSSSFTQQQTITITKTDKRDTFVPGLTYHTSIFIGHDDEPVGTSGIINVIPTVTTAEVKQCNLNNPPTKWLDIQTTVMQNFTVTFDESGYGALNVPISVHTDKVQFELIYGSTQTYIELYSVSSQPVPMLRMNVKQIHARVGDNVTIVTEATEQLNGLISYEIYARGILRHTFLNRLVNTKRTYIDLKITGDLVPQAYVVATHLTRAGHLLSDYIMLKVDGSPCKNKVSVTYNATSLEPRQKLKIDLRADPNSTIYLMFEDEKNRLIGTENDIFSDEITGKVLAWNQNKKSQIGRKRTIKNVSLKGKLLNRFGRKLSYINYKHGQKKLFKRNSKTSAEDIYHESGVVILSNIDMYQEKDSTQLLMFNYVLPQKCIHITTLPPVTYPYGVTYATNFIPTQALGMIVFLFFQFTSLRILFKQSYINVFKKAFSYG